MFLPDPLPQLLERHIRLHSPRANEYHLVIRRSASLHELAQSLRQHEWRLITLFATDERMEEDCRFKLYYLFTAPDEDIFLLLEFHLPARQTRPDHLKSFSLDLRFYPTIRSIFPSVQPFEEAIADAFALFPQFDESVQVQQMLSNAHLLHPSFNQELAPLRRTRPLARLRASLATPPRKHLNPPQSPPQGMYYLPVGPIHAGVIEPGRFLFLQGGEPIEAMPLRLGFKHKGIEKLFETHYRLDTGCELAEKVSGDAAYSHALAYCHAVETLAQIPVPEAAQRWRAILLELERIAQHILTVSGILHDISLHTVGSQMALQWETLMQMYDELFGDRYLRGLTKPGGLELPTRHWKIAKRMDSFRELQATLEEIVGYFLSLAQSAVWNPAVQERAVATGILHQEDARLWGATGFAARASGLIQDDTRLLHPQGVYADSQIQAILQATFIDDLPEDKSQDYERIIPLSREDMQGDVYARFLLRLAEVETSFYLIDSLLHGLDKTVPSQLMLPDSDVQRFLRLVKPFDAGLGYAESSRGGVYYWVQKGPRNTIARCAVTGPSILNWFVFPHAVARHPRHPDQINILADFPLINKSFNLSYAEHDL